MAGRLSATADLLWRRVPSAAARVSTLLGAVLGDGAYLRAWPALALLAPPLAAAVGFALGATHPGEVYSYSIAVMALLAAVGALGAALGFWALVGFAAGDIVLANGPAALAQTVAHSPNPGTEISHIYAPLVLSYLVLGVLLVVVPLVAAVLRLQTVAALELRLRLAAGSGRLAPMGVQGAGYLAHMGVQAVLSFFWAQAASFLIRPMWSFSGGAPPIEAIAPLQTQAWAIVLATMAAVGLRAVLATAVGADDRPLPGVPSRRRWPRWLSIPVQAAVFTVLMLGLLSSVAEAAVFAILLCGVLCVREVLAPRLGFYSLVMRVPVLLRLAALLGIAYLLGSLVLQPLVERGVDSFRPLLLVLVISMAIGACLLPARPEHAEGPKEPT